MEYHKAVTMANDYFSNLYYMQMFYFIYSTPSHEFIKLSDHVSFDFILKD